MGGLGGRHQRVPRLGFEPRHLARLGDGRQVGKNGAARLARDAERAKLTPVDQRLGGGKLGEHSILSIAR